jgi:thermitase
MVVNPVSQYTFAQPTTEQELRDTSASAYGYLIVKAAPGFNEATFTHLGLAIKGKLSLKGCNYYKLYKDSDVLQALEGLKVTKGILFAEPDQKITADAGIRLNNMDPRAVSEEYSIFTTKLKDAWTTYGYGPNKPTVVDIDTGINWVHEDFQKGGAPIVKHAYSWYDLSTSPATEIFTSTYATDPIDYVGTATTDTDDEAHGSHTAGTIAAQGNNGLGVAGVCWNADLVSYKGLLGGSGDTWSIYGSLYHLLNWKTSTNYTHTIPVNMSLGGSYASNFAIEAVEACTENNIVIIASMGNSGQNQVQYPAAYQGVIAVGACNGQDKKVHFSTSGAHISVTAPGYDVISCANGAPDAYVSMSGTSMSAPFVTGLVSYMLTWNPDLTPAQIKTYLEKNTDFIDGATGFTETDGWGRVNCLKTIGAVYADKQANTTPASKYVNVPLQVTVQSSAAGIVTPLAGVPVYLYQTDPMGRITNFVASSITASDPAGDPLLPAAGVAHFNLLRPGTYVARTNITGLQAHSTMATVTTATTDPVNVAVQYNLPYYYVHTLTDAAASSNNTDDIIRIYDATSGKLLTQVDIGNLDVAGVLTTTNQTLLVQIAPWSSYYVGEYALWIGTTLYPTEPAPGTYAAPYTAAGSASHSSGSPQSISVNTLYNGNLTASTDWYRVVAP